MSICTSVPAAGASAIPLAIVIIGVVLTYCVAAYLLFLLIRALRKYIKSEPLRTEKAEKAKTLGEVIKRRRTECKMTQEFVAEALARRQPSGSFKVGKRRVRPQHHQSYGPRPSFRRRAR